MMQNQLKTIDYFKSTLLDPMFEIYEVLEDTSHREYINLQHDLDAIQEDELKIFVEEKNIDFYLNRNENKDLGRRVFYLAELLHKAIAKERINALMDNSDNPKPYNSKNLKNIDIDENNLVRVKDFNIENTGYQRENYVYTLSPAISQSNSSYWISLTIIKLTQQMDLNFKIRLDPFIEIKINDYNPMFYKMIVYGKPLQWENIKQLRNDEFGQLIDEKSYSQIDVTDYVWQPSGREIHFTCEELPKENDIKIRGSRYFHAIFDKATGKIIHCDGAIRIYSSDEYNKRKKFHVRNSEVRKIGKRIKIFQLDDTINQEIFSLLIANFFVWNMDIQSYFEK